MTSHHPDLGSASDWFKSISHVARPIRITTQIWLVTSHQYGISALISQMSFREETSGDVAKCRLLSQAKREYSFLEFLLLNRNNIINSCTACKHQKLWCTQKFLRVTYQGKFINFDLLMGGRENAGLVFLLFKPAFLLIVPSLFSSPIWAWDKFSSRQWNLPVTKLYHCSVIAVWLSWSKRFSFCIIFFKNLALSGDR